MNNEEVFEKFKTGKDWSEMQMYAAKQAWQAAIAYMQEQNKSAEQSEPYLYEVVDADDTYYTKDKPAYNGFYFVKQLFATPQRQQPLKRLDITQVLECIKKAKENKHEPLALANAIQDKMQEINRE